MDVSSVGASGVELDNCKTALRKLARRWKITIDSWKRKYFEAKAEIKRFQNRAADTRRSRDHWKDKVFCLRRKWSDSPFVLVYNMNGECHHEEDSTKFQFLGEGGDCETASG